MLKIRSLDAYYGEFQVLYDVELDVSPGEVVVVVGANGAGKTSLINALSGTIDREGEVWFDQRNISTVPAHEIAATGLVQVPEGRRLFPFLSVMENLELGAYPAHARASADDTKRRVFDLMPRLRERVDQLAGSLSGGEQQLCAIGRALMSQPRVLMLDEPTLGLAPIMVSMVFELIDEIRASGTTILLVEQNVNRSLELADRGYVLEGGRVVLEGTGAELLANDRLKAAYLGG
ncbi:ABC transporter ATP-binding protein [Pusillimonas sp. SM2304]|uniref:ABC transporter ATP-binding protein n=1 Tax=Pusillimonas sp. SM2304 TaxID=3073241 RepID=UPI002873FFF1|nr:ABC transporter ATP-binding protein [Pusillimonas sp. SM2304]MDS1139580.1 ABC transporter ATP-binding protein [Pusillimonas sp. SM2304]